MMTLICGLPNAGKTTYSKQFQNVIHYDDVTAPKGERPICVLCNIVSAMDDVCVEGVFLRAWERKRVVKAYNGTERVCLWLDTPLEECIARENRNRGLYLINRCHALFEPPTLDEGWDEIRIVRFTE